MKFFLNISMFMASLGNTQSELTAKKPIIEFFNKYKDKYEELDKILLINKLSHDSAKLSIPVSTFSFDYYYKYLSEFKYLDEYKFNDYIFVFNKNSTNKNKYKESHKWLNHLEQTQKYIKFTDIDGSWDTYNRVPKVNWINGYSHQGANLRNILSLDLPSGDSNKFSQKQKKILLYNGFQHRSRVDLFSAYFGDGGFHNTNKLNSIVYGQLPKQEYKRYWYDVYNLPQHNPHDRWPSCTYLSKITTDKVKDNRQTPASFNSLCGGFNVFNSKWGSSFPTPEKKLYTSGFASYQEYNGYYNTNNVAYSLLGALSPEEEHKPVSLSNNKTLWYVDYDKVFSPEISNIAFDENIVKLKIKINENLIKDNVDDFLSSSNYMKFKFKFKINNEFKELYFQLKDIMSDKEFDISLINSINTLVMSDSSISIESKNELIELIGDEKDFIFSIDESLLNKHEHFLNKLTFDIDSFKNYFYSELIDDKKKIYKHFYLSSEKNPSIKIPISDYYYNKLNVSLSGSDLLSEAKLTYKDPFQDKEINIDIKNMNKLSDISLMSEKYINLIGESIYNTNHFYNTNSSYFLNNVYLNKNSQNIFDGVSTYCTNSKHINESVKNVWNEFYKDKCVDYLNNDDIFIRLKDQSLWSSANQLSDYFYTTESAKNALISLDNFSFVNYFDNKSEKKTEDKKILVSLKDGINKQYIAKNKIYTLSENETKQLKDIKIKNNIVSEKMHYSPLIAAVAGGVGASAILGKGFITLIKKQII